MSNILNERDFIHRVQKFNLDDPQDRGMYEALLNNPDIQITRDQVTFDRTKGNQALIIVWWKEPV